MKIKILNKNNNAEYDVDEGSVYTEVKNETLDSRVFTISNQLTPLKMEPFDIVEIIDYDFTSRYMCIDTYVETMIGVNPIVYKYEIHLFSETKQLENTVLPNLKITKMSGRTLTLWTYIDRYLTLYCPKVYVNNNGTPTLTYLFDWSELQDSFSDVECPEMQWNTPTLREVLNDLMMVKDCIPVVRQGKITYIDLTEVNTTNWKDNNHINYVTKSMSSEDYVSELQVNLVNVTNHFRDADNTVNRTEYINFTSSDSDVAIKTSNCFLKTQYPIYKIHSLKIMFVGRYTYLEAGSPVTQYIWTEYDLCNVPSLLTEYKEFLLKDINYYTSVPTTLNGFGNTQNWSLYYTRGTNRIENFFNKNRLFLWVTKDLLSALQEAIMKAKDTHGTYNNYRAPDEWYQSMFKIEYETLDGCVFRASKNEERHNRVIIDNQTNSYVDSYKQGFLEYQKANRLGNEQLQINARFLPTDTPIRIGDMYDDCVIYQCQYQFYKNHIEVNALATKNYILRDYFTGVKSKIRSWAIAEGSEALTRYDVRKKYYEFSYHRSDKHRGDITKNLYYLSPLYNYTAKPLEYCFSRTSAGQPSAYIHDYRSYPTMFNLDLIKRIVGNSIVLTVSFPDNTLVGKSIDTEIINLENMSISYAGVIDWADTYQLGGLPIKNIQYTNDKGEFEYITLVFADDFNLSPKLYESGGDVYYNDPVDYGFIDPSTTNEERRIFLFFTLMKPIVLRNQYESTVAGEEFSYVIRSEQITLYKDSQEIPNISIQLEYCSDTTNICFGEEWMKRQKMVSIVDNDVSNYILSAYASSYYNFRNPNSLPSQNGLIANYNCEVHAFSDSFFDILFTDFVYNNPSDAQSKANNLVKDTCFYLNDNGKVILAFNNVTGQGAVSYESGYAPYIRIYMNILEIRDKYTYDADNHYLIID